MASFGVYKNVNLEATGLSDSTYNTILFGSAIRNNYGTLKKQAKELFGQFMQDCNSLEDLENCNK